MRCPMLPLDETKTPSFRSQPRDDEDLTRVPRRPGAAEKQEQKEGDV